MNTLLSCVLFYCFLLRVHAASNAYFIKTLVPKVIDGNGSDWSTITTTHPITNVQYQQLGLFKAAYDANNIYFFLQVTTGNLKNAASMGNFQQALYTGAGASICFGPFNNAGTNTRIVFTQLQDGNVIFVMRPTWSDSSSHPYDYFTTASGDFHVDYEWFLQQEGGNVSFISLPTGGWTAEVLIPWKVLGYTATDGNYIPFDIEILVPDSSGSIIQEAGWWFEKGFATATEDIVAQARLYPLDWGQALMSVTDVGPQKAVVPPIDPAFDPRGISIPFSIPVSETVGVTINIIDSETNWVYRELVRGKLMTKGDYTVYWDGYDRENKIVPAGKYRVVVAYYPPLNTTFLGSVGNNGVPPYPTADGLGSLGGIHYGPMAVTYDSTGLYLLHSVDEGFGGVRKINPITSEPIWVAGMGIFVYSNAIAVEKETVCVTGDSQGVLLMLCFNSTTGASVDSLSSFEYAGQYAANVSGMAMINSTAYVAIPNLILTATPTSEREHWTQGNISIPGLINLCRYNESFLIIVTATTLEYYDIETGVSTTFMTGLSGPRACTVGGDNGDVYVTNGIQVTKYNYYNELLMTIGTEGGRPLAVNPYNPYQLKNAYSMSVSPDNNLWIAEHGVAPTRFAVFSTDNGTWVRDFYGPIGYESVIVDLDDSSSVYYVMSGSYPWLVQTKVNYEAYAANSGDSQHGFSVEAIFLLTQNGVDFSELNDVINNSTWGCSYTGYSSGYVFIANNGLKYLFLSGYHRGGSSLFTWDNSTNHWKLKVAFNQRAALGWQDLNNDGLVQNTEYFHTNPNMTQYAILSVDRNLNLYALRYTISPASIDQNGLPRYDAPINFDFFYSPSNLPIGMYVNNFRTSYGIAATTSTSENSTYAALSFGPAGDQAFWDRSSEARMMKISNGTVQWIIGKKDASMALNGDDMMLFPFAGEVDGVACVADIMSNFNCFTSDGLDLGWLLTDASGNSATYGYNCIDIENAAQALFIKDPATGKRMLFTLSTGDLRILEVVGPFGDAVVRSYSDIYLDNPLPRLTGTQPQSRVFDLQYHTQGTGADGYFYSSLPFADGWDWEWVNEVPAVTLQTSSGTIVSEIRLRRDAGELNIFADVLGGSFPYFPLNNSAEGLNPTLLFRNAGGVEILIGPTPSQRKAAGLGDTRIFLSATYTGQGEWIGYAFACRPASPPVDPTYLRTQDVFGNYTKEILPGPVNFTEITKIPGAQVGIMPRTDQLGFRVEASIPLSLLAELTSLQSVSYRRYAGNTPTGTTSEVYTSVRPDINTATLPLSLNIAVYIPQSTGVIRVPWVADGFTGTNPSVMNPSLWATIEPPATLLIYTASPSTAVLSYQQTISTQLSSYTMATLSPPSNALVGGLWTGPSASVPNAPLSFLSPPPIPGFNISYVSGADSFKAMNSYMREVPYVDGSGWGIDVARESTGGAHPNTSSLIMHVQTAFAQGTTGELHIIWGDFTDNTFTLCYLAITDTTHNITYSGKEANYSKDLSFTNGYNSGSFMRETIVSVGESSLIVINLTNSNWKEDTGAYIEMIWIEPLVVPSYNSPANITLICQSLRSTTPITSVTFYSLTTLIGTTTANQPLTWENVNAGQYQVVAVGIDKYGGQSNSTTLTINVLGPMVSPLYPLNGTNVPLPITLKLQVGENNPTATINAISISISTYNGQTNYKLTSSPWEVALGSLPAGKVSVSVTAVDSVGDYSILEYLFFAESSLPTSNIHKIPIL